MQQGLLPLAQRRAPLARQRLQAESCLTAWPWQLEKQLPSLLAALRTRSRASGCGGDKDQ